MKIYYIENLKNRIFQMKISRTTVCKFSVSLGLMYIFST